MPITSDGFVMLSVFGRFQQSCQLHRANWRIEMIIKKFPSQHVTCKPGYSGDLNDAHGSQRRYFSLGFVCILSLM